MPQLQQLTDDASPACCAPVTPRPLSAAEAQDISVLFKAIANPVRLRLVSLIATHAGGEACVCELTGAFHLSEPTISHHLKVLREAGLTGSQQRGTWVYYRINHGVLARLATVLSPGHAGLVVNQ